MDKKEFYVTTITVQCDYRHSANRVNGWLLLPVSVRGSKKGPNAILYMLGENKDGFKGLLIHQKVSTTAAP